MKFFFSIMFIFLMGIVSLAAEKRVNTNFLAASVSIPNIEYEHQVYDNWFLANSFFYRVKSSPYLVTTAEKVQFSSIGFMLKRYFDYETTGFYLGAGITLSSYKLYYHSGSTENTLYNSSGFDSFSWIYEIGYTDFINSSVFYTAYLGASEHYSDFNNMLDKINFIFSLNLGLCIGYQF